MGKTITPLWTTNMTPLLTPKFKFKSFIYTRLYVQILLDFFFILDGIDDGLFSSLTDHAWNFIGLRNPQLCTVHKTSHCTRQQLHSFPWADSGNLGFTERSRTVRQYGWSSLTWDGEINPGQTKITKHELKVEWLSPNITLPLGFLTFVF